MMSNNRVLIVDDDLPILEELRMFPWESHGFRIVAEAANGREALKYCHELEPDIIISDIVMPIMDGMEFAKKVKQWRQSAQIIFITLYRDFNYAKEAIHLGVKEYLIKGVYREDDLLQALIRARDELEEKEEHLILENQSARVRMGNELNSLLGIRWHEYECIDRIGLTYPFRLSVVKLLFETETDAWVRTQIIDTIFNKTEKLQIKSYLLDNSTIHLHIHNHHKEITHIMSLFLQGVARNSGTRKLIPVLVSTSETINRFDEYRKAFSLTCTLQKLAFFSEKFTIISPHDIKFRLLTESESLSLTFRIRQICGFPATLKTFLHKELREFLYVNHIDPNSIKQLFSYWHDQILQNKDEKAYTDTIFFSTETYMELVEHLIESSTKSKISDIMTSRFELDRMLIYIHENYTRDVSLKEIASVVGLSENYLGQIFKKTYGESFKDYITRLKMNAAANLLLHSNLKVYEIAEKIGISSYKYFSTLFHKHFNMSPTVYKSHRVKEQ